MGIKKILVTGSEGYIGAVLVPKLIRKGYEVVGIDTCYFGRFNKGVGFRLIKKDIRNITDDDLQNIDAVIHLAALSNDPVGELNPNLTNEINFKATIHLARLAKKQEVKRFLFSSSCSIYGIAKKKIVDEQSPTTSLTAYAKSKVQSENELKKLADENFCIGLLRNSTVYGYSPSFRDDLVVNNLVCRTLLSGEIRIMSDGTPWRPLIDTRDLSDIFIEFLKVDADKINGKIINVGFKENNLQVKDLINEIQRLLPKSKVIYTGEHGRDSRSYRVDFTRFKKIFPRVNQHWSIHKSINDLISQLKKNKFSKKTYSRISALKILLQKNKLEINLRWRSKKV